MATCWRSTIASELPNADHVVDRFHVVRNAMTVLVEARHAAQRTRRGQAHRKDLYQARYTLATRCDRLSAAQHAELSTLLETHPHLAAAWELTQRFHRVFQADGIDAALHALGELADAMARLNTGFGPGVRGAPAGRPNGATTTRPAAGPPTVPRVSTPTSSSSNAAATAFEPWPTTTPGSSPTAPPGHPHHNQAPNLRPRPADRTTTGADHTLTG